MSIDRTSLYMFAYLNYNYNYITCLYLIFLTETEKTFQNTKRNRIGNLLN